MQVTGIVSVLLVGLLLKPDYIFGLLETVATLAVILIYCTANLALTAYIRREHPQDFSLLETPGVSLGGDFRAGAGPGGHGIPGASSGLTT